MEATGRQCHKNRASFQLFINVPLDGDGASILKAMKYRLDDNTVTESRKWAYFCSAFGSNDKESLEKVLLRFINSKASIVSKVASDLLMKLG